MFHFRHLKLGLQDWVGVSHEEWVAKHPGQVVLTVVSIQETRCFLHIYRLRTNLVTLIIERNYAFILGTNYAEQRGSPWLQ